MATSVICSKSLLRVLTTELILKSMSLYKLNIFGTNNSFVSYNCITFAQQRKTECAVSLTCSFNLQFNKQDIQTPFQHGPYSSMSCFCSRWCIDMINTTIICEGKINESKYVKNSMLLLSLLPCFRNKTLLALFPNEPRKNNAELIGQSSQTTKHF